MQTNKTLSRASFFVYTERRGKGLQVVMASFRSLLLVCGSFLVAFFFSLDYAKKRCRYDFLVKGEVCIIFDHQEDSLKVVGPTGCVTVPINKSEQQKMREQIENEMGHKIQDSLNQIGTFPHMQQPMQQPMPYSNMPGPMPQNGYD